jgi:hypothetical protein
VVLIFAACSLPVLAVIFLTNTKQGDAILAWWKKLGHE